MDGRAGGGGGGGRGGRRRNRQKTCTDTVVNSNTLQYSID